MVLSTSTTSKCVEVQIEGVRIIDTGSDITILSASAFQEIATMFVCHYVRLPADSSGVVQVEAKPSDIVYMLYKNTLGVKKARPSRKHQLLLFSACD